MIQFRPKILRWPQIWDIVEEFRLSYKYTNTFPVQIEEIIEFDLGLDITPILGLKQKVGVEAFLSKDLKSIKVDSFGYSSNAFLPRLRFTLAEGSGSFNIAF